MIKQFSILGDIDQNRVHLIGYSHGGYGAFAIGTRIPHRFASVHASASAPTAGVSTAAASAADTLAAAAAAAMGSGDPGPSQARAPGHEEDDELEERMRQMVSEHGGAERWGRQYSSLTHRSILEGFRALEVRLSCVCSHTRAATDVHTQACATAALWRNADVLTQALVLT